MKLAQIKKKNAKSHKNYVGGDVQPETSRPQGNAKVQQYYDVRILQDMYKDRRVSQQRLMSLVIH